MTEHERIDELLNSATDPVQRAIVIVLGSINRDLLAQTAATARLANGVEQSNTEQRHLNKILQQHIADEEVMLADFRGRATMAAWAGPVLFSVLGLLCGYIWMQQAASLRDLAARLDVIREQQVINTEWLRNLERRQNTDEAIRGTRQMP